MVLQLFDYWRSSAAYRVRIALALKGVDYDSVAVDILPGHDEQLSDAYKARNPQGRVPMLTTEKGDLTQSMAIVEWIDEIWPDPPLLPADAWARAQTRSFALTVACDIHPLNNIIIQRRIRQQWDADETSMTAWGRFWIDTGLKVLEAKLAAAPASAFAFGEAPTMADLCLIPQLYNARRIGLEMSAYPNLARVDASAAAHPAFVKAAPENQPDAPKGTA
jgi:maleylacetoacetate isomerase